MGDKKRIFIAYAWGSKRILPSSWGDKPKVRDLYDRLEKEGFDPWLDEKDLVAGLNWQDQITKAIDEADIFLACLSKNAVDKTGFLQEEIRLALDAYTNRPEGSIFIIPVRLDACEIPNMGNTRTGVNLRDIHWVDLFESDGFGNLVAAINMGGVKDVTAIVEAADQMIQGWPEQKLAELSSILRRFIVPNSIQDDKTKMTDNWSARSIEYSSIISKKSYKEIVDDMLFMKVFYLHGIYDADKDIHSATNVIADSPFDISHQKIINATNEIKLALAHDDLINEWGFLKKIILSCEEDIIFRENLRGWCDGYNKTDESWYILRGPFLKKAEDLIDRYHHEIDDDVKKFVEISRRKAVVRKFSSYSLAAIVLMIPIYWLLFPSLETPRLVTGNDFPPFIDRASAGGGMITQIVKSAYQQAGLEINTIEFINDWPNFIQNDIMKKTYDASFAWYGPPKCENIENFPDNMKKRCDFYYSESIYSTEYAFYATTEYLSYSPISQFSDLNDKIICRPRGYYTLDLLDVGLNPGEKITLREASNVNECFKALDLGEVEIVSVNPHTAKRIIDRRQMYNDVKRIENLSTPAVMHLIAHKNNPRSEKIISEFNKIIEKFKKSSEYKRIIKFYFP